MRIDKLSLRQVGPFSSLDLKFPVGVDPTKADVVLLVGPNGSGKSSILYAIAGSLTNESIPALSDRFRGPESLVDGSAVIAGSSNQFGCWPSGGGGIPDSGLPSTGNESKMVLWGPMLHTSGSQWQFSVGESVADDARLAFGYAATRTLASQTQQISPIHSGALFGRFDFDRPLAFELFSKWVNDVVALRDAATIEGELESAEKVSSGISKLESFISEVIGTERKFARDLTTGDIVLKSADGERIPILALPEGLKSILSWLGDLLRRLYRIPTDGLSPTDLPFLLLLDEIDVHLHPKWQRLVVPAVEKLFPNAQIILSTHSPFVVASADDASVVWLNEDGTIREDLENSSRRGWSYGAILELMGIDREFDVTTTKELNELDELAAMVRVGKMSIADYQHALAAKELPKTEEIQFIVDDQIRQLRRFVERNGIVSV